MLTIRQWIERHPGLWSLVVSGLLVLNFGARTADAHGYMTEPRPREADHLKGDIKGWPIAGLPPRLTKLPCLDIPANTRFTEIHPGPLTLKLLFGDGANHVGLCQVYLLDPDHPEQKVKIGERMDCARSDHPGPGQKGEAITGHMNVTVPDTVPCNPAHCVLQWEWIATHISITRPEYYDNCADVTVLGAHQEILTAAAPIGPLRPVDRAPAAPRSAPPAAEPPTLATGEDAVRQLIIYAMADGGNGNSKAIIAVKRQIEALPLNRQVEPGVHQRARVANERGLQVLREGQMAEAVQAFKAAYQLAPTDVEIVNNFGYAYLRHGDPEAAEPWLVLALVLAPGRVNAWVNLGQAFARQGQLTNAVACFANGYRFSKHQTATREFLVKLAEDENEDKDVRKAAQLMLQLPLEPAALE